MKKTDSSKNKFPRFIFDRRRSVKIFAERIVQMTKNLFKKNPTLFIAICIALFIPLIIAVIFAFTVNPYSVTENNLGKISVQTPDGKSYEFTDEKVCSLYVSMTENTTEVDSHFDTFEEKKFYEITFFENNTDPIVYKFYPSTNLADCVYASPDGKYFIINKKVAEKILTREEFASVDNENLLPVFTVSGLGEDLVITPDSYDWTYTAIGGAVTSLNGNEKANNPVVKFDDSKDGKLEMSFNKKPDSLSIVIKKGDDDIFNDKYENLADVSILHYENDTKLSLTAVAEWYKLDDSEYYGTATYTFDLLYDCAPKYKILNPRLPNGEFTFLFIENFNDGELLGISSDLGLGEKVHVYDLNGAKITPIPLTSKLTSGEHIIKLTTESGHESSVKLTVANNAPPVYKKQKLIINEKKSDNNKDGLAEACTKASLKEFDVLVKKLTDESANEQLFGTDIKAFGYYPTGAATLTAGASEYGMERTILSYNETELTYTSMGQDMSCKAGQEIKAAANGKVAYAGKTALLGNTVIIDHGFGILTYYGNLDSISVKVGDSTKKGETVLGKAGSTGFACKEGVSAEKVVTCHYAVSLNGCFIEPRRIYGGISFK